MYEFTFLVDEAKDIKPLEKALESFKGKKLNEQSWGKRLLAYPIEKKTSAEFFTWHIDIDSKGLDEFKTKLNYDKLVIRYLFLNSDHTPKQPTKTDKS